LTRGGVGALFTLGAASSRSPPYRSAGCRRGNRPTDRANRNDAVTVQRRCAKSGKSQQHWLTAPCQLPEPGQLVHLRQRRWLVEAVEEALRLGEATLVHAACVDDDAQGEPVSVLWDMSWMPASSRTHCPTSG
jgi:hypothetical protein